MAAKKVEALLEMASVTRSAVEKIYTMQSDDASERDDAFNGYGNALRSGLVLFGPKTIAELTAFSYVLSSARTARSTSEMGGGRIAWDKLQSEGEAPRNKLFEVIRLELYPEAQTAAGSEGEARV